MRQSTSDVAERRLRFSRKRADSSEIHWCARCTAVSRQSQSGQRRSIMGILRNRRVFGRALVSTLAFAVSVGLLALWETGRGTVLSAGTDTSAPEFAYSGDNEPGFWGETPGWEACAGTARTQRQFHFHTLSEHTVTDRHAAMELHACSRTLPPTTRRSSASCSSSARPIAAEAKRAHGSQHRG